jgi:hypothetical protein
MNRWFALLGSLVLGIVAELLAVFLVGQSASAASPCVQRFYQGVSYVVCTLDLRATQAQPASLNLQPKMAHVPRRRVPIERQGSCLRVLAKT